MTFDVGTGCTISRGCNDDEFTIPHLTSERKPESGNTFVVDGFKYQWNRRRYGCSSKLYTVGFGSTMLCVCKVDSNSNIAIRLKFEWW